MAARLPKDDIRSKMLMYRFPGNRYAKDDMLAGHRLGNLFLVALRDITGDFTQACKEFQQMFAIPGNFFPATAEPVSISARTIEGKIIEGEETIDLGKYEGKRVLEHVFLHPENPQVSEDVITALETADVIIAGPGDLYTTVLPVLIIPAITDVLKKSKAQKFFVINIANKPFETKDYDVYDYVHAIEKHLGTVPFEKIIMNDDTHVAIPKKFHYHYVYYKKLQEFATLQEKYNNVQLVASDLVNEEFPLYHSSDKLAKTIIKAL